MAAVLWSDVTPIPLDEGPSPVCPINYSAKFREIMDYFRAFVQANELSERALSLVTEVIQLNPASYTAWHYRRKILINIKSDLVAEREWLDHLGENNPKNYQLWYHRRWVVDQMQDASEELKFTQMVLDQDGKNYHAWAHRQWVLEAYSLWAGELDWIETMLVTDRRNNSAWNQRYFVVTKTEDIHSDAIRKREADYAWSWIKKSPNNQSPWSYLSAVIKGKSIDEELLAEVEAAASRWVTCPHVLSLLIDIYEQRGTLELINKAVDFCETLATRLAQTHQKYWRFRQDQLKALQTA